MPKDSKKREDFLWVGDSPSLDFVNTEIVRNGERVDLIAQPADFLAWLEYAGFRLEIKINGANALALAVDLGRRYKTTLRKGLEEIVAGRPLPASVLSATNDLLGRPAERSTLLKKLQHYELVRTWHIEAPADFVVPVAAAFADLICEVDLHRIRKCRNPACILFFYDSSKSGTRAWCSLNICGNRLRMAASRKRRKAGLTGP